MARRPLLEVPAARAAEAALDSFRQTDRLMADATGADIVGLKQGEPFDPLGDLDRLIAQAGEHAEHRVRLARGFTLDQLIDAVVEEAPKWGYSAAGTRGFLDGAASTQRLPNQKLATVLEAAGRIGYRIEVAP